LNNLEFENLVQTPKQLKFSREDAEVGVLIDQLCSRNNISITISRLYRLSRQRDVQFWGSHFEQLIDTIMNELNNDRHV
jgi:hypothetical protein